MRFEEYKDTLGMRFHQQEIMTMFSDFLKSGFEVAEVKDWENSYASVGSAYVSLKKVADRNFSKEIRVSKSGGRLFIARITA